MCSIENAINKGFVFVFTQKMAAEIADSVVVAQRQGVQKFLQFLKTLADLRGIRLVRVGISQIELIQDGGAIVTA